MTGYRCYHFILTSPLSGVTMETIGFTPLHLAVQKNDPKCVQFLLEW
jgi:hypothetical protein